MVGYNFNDLEQGKAEGQAPPQQPVQGDNLVEPNVQDDRADLKYAGDYLQADLVDIPLSHRHQLIFNIRPRVSRCLLPNPVVGVNVSQDTSEPKAPKRTSHNRLPKPNLNPRASWCVFSTPVVHNRPDGQGASSLPSLPVPQAPRKPKLCRRPRPFLRPTTRRCIFPDGAAADAPRDAFNLPVPMAPRPSRGNGRRRRLRSMFRRPRRLFHGIGFKNED